MLERTLAPVLEKAAQHYPVVTLTGPRQSGRAETTYGRRSEDLDVVERIVHRNTEATKVIDVPGCDAEVLSLGDGEASGVLSLGFGFFIAYQIYVAAFA